MGNILSVYESFFVNGKEYMRIIVQGIDTKERREKLIKRIKSAIESAIDRGDYLYSQNLFCHPPKASKPYLQKYQIF